MPPTVWVRPHFNHQHPGNDSRPQLHTVPAALADADENTVDNTALMDSALSGRVKGRVLTVQEVRRFRFFSVLSGGKRMPAGQSDKKQDTAAGLKHPGIPNSGFISMRGGLFWCSHSHHPHIFFNQLLPVRPGVSSRRLFCWCKPRGSEKSWCRAARKSPAMSKASTAWI